ncbi:MAG: cysteine desulfurase [Alphaproteobacteria bacterium]|nr:cysteine desulfurase [Alphaproteobacteria bacterium]
MNMAYLDYNATAPLRPEARRAMLEAAESGGNASSVHASGRRARRMIEEARERVAALLGVKPGEVVFTSGGTEANHLALLGAGADQVLVGATEHDSVRLVRADAEALPVDGSGQIALQKLDAALAQSAGRALVSVMLANNETGVIQPIAEVARIARRHGALVHCDAVQAIGKIAVDLRALDVDLLSLSGHKLGGPQGVGALLVRDGRVLEPLLRGGGQEFGRRAGTENLPGIAGMAAALAACLRDLASMDALARLRDGMEARLAALCPELRVWGSGAPRLANTSCLAMPGTLAETQVMALDLAGIEVSAGAACSSGKVRPSHVLRAMGASESEAREAIRVSLGWASTEEDVERFVAAWAALYMRTGGQAARVAAA